MQIQTVKYERRRNLGNWEHEIITLEVKVEDHENAGAAIDAVKTLTEYKLFGEERAAQAEKFRQEIESGDVKREAAIGRWFQQYNEWKAAGERASEGKI